MLLEKPTFITPVENLHIDLGITDEGQMHYDAMVNLKQVLDTHLDAIADNLNKVRDVIAEVHIDLGEFIPRTPCIEIEWTGSNDERISFGGQSDNENYKNECTYRITTNVNIWYYAKHVDDKLPTNLAKVISNIKMVLLNHRRCNGYCNAEEMFITGAAPFIRIKGDNAYDAAFIEVSIPRRICIGDDPRLPEEVV